MTRRLLAPHGHCLIRGELYDEATDIANRNHALGKAA
jgi:hypothetical protein